MPQFRPHETDPLLDIEPHYQHTIERFTEADVGRVRHESSDFLRTFGPTHVGRISENDIFVTDLCVSEGLTNTVQARSGNISPTHLRIRLATGRIAVTIGDTGKYAKDLPYGHASLPDDYADSGRGFAIINGVTKGNFGFRTSIVTKPRGPFVRGISRITGLDPNMHPIMRSRRIAAGKELWFIISTEPIE